MPEQQEQPNNEVLAVKLDYIREDIKIIKGDIKEIKSDFIARREFNDYKKEINSELIANHAAIEMLKEFRWKLAGMVALGSFIASGSGILILKFLVQ